MMEFIFLCILIGLNIQVSHTSHSYLYRYGPAGEGSSSLDPDLTDETVEFKQTWPGGIIPYVIDSFFTTESVRLIKTAMQYWEEDTCIQFVEKTPSDTDFVYIVYSHDQFQSCSSFVGRKPTGGKQNLILSRNCINFGKILHELGHVIGMWHEHNRPDRDIYIEIISENIDPAYLKEFKMIDEYHWSDIPNLRYDIESIMHYGMYASSITDEATIKERPTAPRHICYPRCLPMGQRVKLTAMDKRRANHLYRCTNPTVPPVPREQFCTHGCLYLVSNRVPFPKEECIDQNHTSCYNELFASEIGDERISVTYKWIRMMLKRRLCIPKSCQCEDRPENYYCI